MVEHFPRVFRSPYHKLVQIICVSSLIYRLLFIKKRFLLTTGPLNPSSPGGPITCRIWIKKMKTACMFALHYWKHGRKLRKLESLGKPAQQAKVNVFISTWGILFQVCLHFEAAGEIKKICYSVSSSHSTLKTQLNDQLVSPYYECGNIKSIQHETFNSKNKNDTNNTGIRNKIHATGICVCTEPTYQSKCDEGIRK